MHINSKDFRVRPGDKVNLEKWPTVVKPFCRSRKGYHNCRFVDDGHPAVIAAFRRGTPTEARNFLVVCNFDTRSPQRIAVDLAPVLGSDGPFPCCELLSGAAQVLPDPRLELLLPPCAAQVLRFPASREPVVERDTS